MKHLASRELHNLLSDGSEPAPLLLDVREPWEFAICHIEGSRNVPMAQIPSVVTELDLAAPTVVICHVGMRSREVADYLEQCGFEDVGNLEGGVDAWAREIDTSMPTY